MWKEYNNVEIKGIQCIKSNGATQPCADLCVEASRALMDQYALSGDAIHVLVYVTQSPMFLTPSTSFYIHKVLGLGQDCFQYDTNQGATGLLAGLQLVASLMKDLEQGQKGLLLLGDDVLDAEAGKVNMAAAILMERVPEAKMYVTNDSQGKNYKMSAVENMNTIGEKCLAERLEQALNYAKNAQCDIDTVVTGEKHDSAVRLAFQLCQERPVGNVLLGTYGAGISIMTALCPLEAEIYTLELQ